MVEAALYAARKAEALSLEVVAGTAAEAAGTGFAVASARPQNHTHAVVARSTAYGA